MTAVAPADLPATGIDMPLGRIDRVPSGITGQLMAYFTPDPLPELVHRCQTVDVPTRQPRNPVSGLLLLRSASKDSRGEIDVGQARRFLEFMTGRRLSHLEDFLALGKEISPRANGLRNEIVFVGGDTSSSARHIYAPDERLPSLMASLQSSLSSGDLGALDPLLRSAVVGMFCAYMHPFRDGNGRWLRLIASSTARRQSDIWPSFVGTAFLNCCKHRLSNDVWPEARSKGLRRFLQLLMEFDRLLERGLKEHGLHETVEAIESTLLPNERRNHTRLQFLGQIFARGYVPLNAMRSVFGLSSRAAEGRLRSTAGLSDFIRYDEGELIIDGLVDVVDSLIDEASTEVT